MTNDSIEAKALALVNGVKTERGRNSYSHYTRLNRALDDGHEALCRAIEQHEAFRQEVERLNGLITATADHWLTLQVKHPIQWEGAINGAMAAACAEIEKLEDYKQKVSDALLRYHAPTHVPHGLQEFIIPKPKPDPLEEVLSEIDHAAMWVDECAKEIRASLDARGFEIREKG